MKFAIWMPTRREFIACVGATGVLASLNSAHLGIAAQASGRIRKDIYSLDPAGTEVTALRAGVAVMRARAPTDPTSWTFQANIHGLLDTPTNALWAKCQHGQWWFLPWHRMYLFYFERILMAAALEAGVAVPADFGLPYWNYSDIDSSKFLPQVFRDLTYTPASGGAAQTNPLREDSRRTDLNDPVTPTPLSDDTVDTSPALSTTTFVSTSSGTDGFGGQQVSSPRHFANLNHGGLESLPHDQIHDAIGGLMGDPDTAANDAIFWLHHCNIDRLWNKWLNQGGGRKDPYDRSVWCQQMFSFADENKMTVSQPVRRFLNYATGNLLDYKYDDPHAAAPTGQASACAPPTPLVAATTSAGSAGAHNGHATAEANMPTSTQPTSTLSTFPPRLALTDKTMTFKLQIPEEHRTAVEGVSIEHAHTAPELLLQISGIDPKSVEGGYYDVYINLPAHEAPKRTSSSFLGSMSSFALKGKARHGDGESSTPQEISKTFSLSKIAMKLARVNQWPQHEISATFVPREMGPAKPDAPRVVFRHLNLVQVDRTQP